MIEWTIQIANVNVSTGRADVNAVRLDTDTGGTEQYQYNEAVVATAADRTALLNTIKAAVEAKATRDAQIAAFVDNLEQSAKTNLEAWELTR